MSSVGVVTDSSCDLPPSLVTANGIDLVPHTVRVEEEEITDDGSTRTGLWEKIAAASTPVETIAPTAAAFSASFEALAVAGAEGILVLTMSGELSATHQAAVLATERLRGAIPVRVVDSRTISMALGFLVLDAAQRARQGATLHDLVATAAHRSTGTGLVLAFDSLHTLRRRGGVGGVQHRVASWLDSRPLMKIERGILAEVGQWRGTAEAIEALAGKVEPNAARLVDLAVLAAPPANTDDLVARLAHLVPPERLHRSTLGPVLGGFTGPAAIGVAWSTV